MNETPKKIAYTRNPETRNQNAPYEEKFASLIRAILENQSAPAQHLVIREPWVIGDTYEEVIESLSRLAGTNLTLAIVRRDVPITNN